MSRRKRYSESCQISEMRTYALNGYSQKILMEGENAQSPILIFLHGGPGSPVPFNAGCRGLFPELTKDFIMVYWDQLGCGINDHVIDERFSIEDYVSMTMDLIRALHQDFPENAINLFGISWGSVLAAGAAARIPELLHRAVAYGQVTRNLFFNNEVFGRLEEARLNNQETARLHELKTKKPSDLRPEDMLAMAKLIRKHTEGYQTKNGGRLPIGKLLRGMLASPDYALRDIKAVGVNGAVRNQSLRRELFRLDLCPILERISIPYLIMQGDADIVTSTAYIKSFMNASRNRNLSLDILQDSGHVPGGNTIALILQRGFAFLRQA